MLMSTENNVVYSVKIPEGREVMIEGDVITVKGALGTNSRKFNDALVSITKDGDAVTISALNEKKLRKKAANTANAIRKEIENDMKGVGEHFEIMMETVFSHFPITVEVKDREVNIKNIFGERFQRVIDIVGSTKVDVKDNVVKVYGISRDDVSQTAANIRKGCKAHNKDERIFQDGVYYSIVE